MKASRLIAIVFLASALFVNDNNPAKAVHTEPNGCSAPWTGYLRDNPAGADFKPACDGHDNCYEIFGKLKTRCDSEFYDGMRSACEKQYVDVRRNPLGAVTTVVTGGGALAGCYAAADTYYTAVALAPQASDAYRRAQQPEGSASRPREEVLPTRVTAIANLNGNEECYQVDSRKGWQNFTFDKSRTRVTSISGSWSVDSRNYAGVGAQGYSGDAARGLEPYNQYKYDQNFAFGALFIDVPTDGYGYVQVSQAQSLPKSITRTSMRINDADNALGDNGGSLRVCFGN